MLRIIQANKIIPELYNAMSSPSHTGMINIKSFIFLYYIQNSLFIALSLWILYMILIKLNLFIEDIYLFIITSGILGSIVFISYHPLQRSRVESLEDLLFNNKIYPLYKYLLFLLFIFFYILILPLLVFNIINSPKFIMYFKDYDIIHDYLKTRHYF